jgi:hypothetical protein
MVEFKQVDACCYVRDFVTEPVPGNALRVKINGEEYTLPGAKGSILLNGKPVAMDTHVNDGDILRTSSGKDAEAVLVDIFRYLNINPHDKVGKRLKLLINEAEAQYTTPLLNNDEVKVLFE